MTLDELQKIAETEREAREEVPAPRARLHRRGVPLFRRGPGSRRAEKGSGRIGHGERSAGEGRGLHGAVQRRPAGLRRKPTARCIANVTPEEAPEVIRGLDTGERSGLEHCPTDMPFFQRQKKIVLENSGKIDPERIEDYIAHDGYLALVTAITEMTPQEVIQQIVRSGLRGRGGAGYPTGLKWSTVAKTGEQEKYVICNADEGDPGAFMDRAVLESDPHRVLEGMAIAAYAVGAQKGYIYVRAEYPLAVKHLQDGHPPGGAAGPAGQQHLRHAFQLPRGYPAGRGRVRVRRRDRADRLHRRQARHAAAPPAVSRRGGPVGLPHPHQQRGDLRQRGAHYPQRPRVVRRHRHGEEQGHQGVRAGRPGGQHRV